MILATMLLFLLVLIFNLYEQHKSRTIFKISKEVCVSSALASAEEERVHASYGFCSEQVAFAIISRLLLSAQDPYQRYSVTGHHSIWLFLHYSF